jgi:hypothetical protein
MEYVKVTINKIKEIREYTCITCGEKYLGRIHSLYCSKCLKKRHTEQWKKYKMLHQIDRICSKCNKDKTINQHHPFCKKCNDKRLIEIEKSKHKLCKRCGIDYKGNSKYCKICMLIVKKEKKLKYYNEVVKVNDKLIKIKNKQSRNCRKNRKETVIRHYSNGSMSCQICRETYLQCLAQKKAPSL